MSSTRAVGRGDGEVEGQGEASGDGAGLVATAILAELALHAASVRARNPKATRFLMLPV
jgi:hypothetical protein